MKYRTNADLRRRFTPDVFDKMLSARMEEIEKEIASLREGAKNPKNLLTIENKGTEETYHFMIAYSNNEEMFISRAKDLNDEDFFNRINNLAKKGYFQINARHCTIQY